MPQEYFQKKKPDVIFFKGWLCYSTCSNSDLNEKKIPVVSHESDLTPGLANKIASPFCGTLCVTFPESLKYIKDNKGELTGTPIREDF